MWLPCAASSVQDQKCFILDYCAALSQKMCTGREVTDAALLLYLAIGIKAAPYHCHYQSQQYLFFEYIYVVMINVARSSLHVDGGDEVGSIHCGSPPVLRSQRPSGSVWVDRHPLLRVNLS